MRRRQLLAKLWEAAQVELQGSYSDMRVVKLANYTRETSSLRAWTVVLASPFPCLLVTFLIDAIPLADPSEGIAANKAFFVRHYLCLLMTTGMVIHQFRRGMQYMLPYPMKAFVRDSVVVAALTTGTLYALGRTIGFPVPFSSLVLIPAWSLMTLSAMAIQWARRIRENPLAATMLTGMAKLMLCEVLLILIYPPYYHLFTTLPEKSQTAFTLLLPVIKLLMRNLFARAVRHLGDETPELVVFNADAFGSLFVSYCMQSSPSIWSTIVIIAADALLIGLCLRDIMRCREGLDELESQIENGLIWRHCHGTLGFKLLGGRKPTTLERANILLELGVPCHLKNSQSADSRAAKILPLDSSQQRPGPNVGDLGIIGRTSTGVGEGSEADSSDFAPFSYISRTSTAWLDWSTVYPERAHNTRAQRRSPSPQMRINYMLKVRRLLYMTEFLLLLNYIEVIIPQSFAIYLITTYILSNREYYAIFHDMNESQLYEMLYKLLVYWFLQLLSLLCLNMLVQRILGLSPVRLLAFVLENQVDFVQIHLTYWLCYNAQCTLEHIGYDYTFRFTWLSNK